MKNIIIIIASVFYSCVAYSQDASYCPQVREGVEWGYSCASVGPGGKVDFFRLQFNGKTTINDKEYSNLYRYDTFFLFPSAQKPIAWMREENKKVYGVFNTEYKELASDYGCTLYGTDNEEVLIMDYGINPGDTFSVGKSDFDMTATCIAVESIMIGDTQREIFSLSIRSKWYADEIATVKFVEGIGPISYIYIRVRARSFSHSAYL